MVKMSAEHIVKIDLISLVQERPPLWVKSNVHTNAAASEIAALTQRRHSARAAFTALK